MTAKDKPRTRHLSAEACGCKIAVDENGKATIQLCSLHHAAPKILKTCEKFTAWLDRLADQADKEAAASSGRFESHADACRADARNYRATAQDVRAAIAKARGE